MDGSAELLQLAHLLRKGAEAARDIGTIRFDDRMAIETLAARTIEIAEAMEALARAPRPS